MTSQTNQHRHCMVVHNSYPHAEPRVLREARALIQAGHYVDVIALTHPNDNAPVEMVDGITVYRMPVRRDKGRGAVGQLFEYLSFLFHASFKLTRLHIKKKYDVVQVHNLPNFLVFAALVPRLTGAKVILDIHDLMPEFYCSRFETSMDSLPVRLALVEEWISCKFANHVITVTEPWRQTLTKRSKSMHKTSVVMNLADNASYDKVTREYDPPADGEFRLFYHGTITYRYGIDMAIQAFAKARETEPRLKFVIHGRGEYLETLKQVIRDAGVEEHVRLTSDLISTDALAELISTGHLSIVPYRNDIFTDGILPTKLMEYSALGLPAIVSRSSAIEAYFGEDMVAYLDENTVDVITEQILALVNDPDRLRALSNKARGFNEKYNWKSNSAEYIQLVETLGN